MTKVYGQSTTANSNGNIATETNLNKQLMQNSALSDKYLQQSGAQPTRLSTGSSISGGSNNNLNLTDQDKQLSENYVDQAAANKIINDKCSGDMQAICQGQAGKHKFMGMDSNMVGMVAKAYGMFSGLAGSKWTVKSDTPDASKTPGDTNPGEAQKTPGDSAKAGGDKKNEEDDWCKYIPAATETLATFSQQQGQQAMTQTQTAATAQKDTLLKAAQSHEDRAKTAKIQMYGWYGGAACYGAKAAVPPGLVINTSLVVKIGAAGFLGAFYQNEVAANEDYAKQVRAIADALPGKGDCNPVTQNACYCANADHKSDAEYNQYCNPNATPGAAPIAANSYRVACTDNTMKLDPACSCVKTNTCMDTYLATQDTTNALGLGTGAGSPLRDIKALTRGELVGGNLSGNVSGTTKAIADKAMREIASKLPASNPLNPAQKGFADKLMANGVPAEIARTMALQDIKPGSDKGLAAFSGGLNNSDSNYASRGRVVDFSGGHGIGGPGKIDKKNDDFLAKLTANNKTPGANSKLLEFAAKAEEEARKKGQIGKSDRPLFEIISNRYQESGRRLLEIDSPRN